MTVAAAATEQAASLRHAVEAVCDCLEAGARRRQGPFRGGPAELAAAATAVEVLPEEGRPLGTVMGDLGRLVVDGAVDPGHPACAAHLQCQPLPAALAGDLLAGATNQSLDSWDQGPVATALERRVLAALGALAGLPGGDGVFTSGGTQSNLMGLLLAREAAVRRAGHGVLARARVLCSRDAHFSVGRAAALLGLGGGAGDAVVPVAVDARRRLDPAALDRELERLGAAGLEPVALVATAGTTDFGAFDPLPAMAERARARGLWLHVDAAYGGALLLSDRHRRRLDGLALADSVGVDFHKLLWQPVACGAFVAREPDALAPLDLSVPYLNEGGEHLVSRSLATTRRFDALKLLVTFQALGRRALAARLDRVVLLAGEAAALVERAPGLRLAARPELTTVVFRCLPGDPRRSDRLNDAVRASLLTQGRAVIGRTRVDGRVHLKLTLLNPDIGSADLAALVDLVAATAARLDRQP